MKPNTNTTLPALLLVACLVAAAGCASFQSNAGKTLVTVAAVTDASMTGYAQCVVLGQVPDDTQAKVQVSYAQYQACMRAAVASYGGLSSAAGQPAWTQALTALQASQAQLLALVQVFTSTTATAPIAKP